MAKTKEKKNDRDLLKIEGVEYDLPKRLTVREFRLIKLQYAILGGHLDYAVAAGDQDGYAAYALTALRRAKPDTPIEDQILYLENLPAGDIDIVYADEPEDKPRPPA